MFKQVLVLFSLLLSFCIYAGTTPKDFKKTGVLTEKQYQKDLRFLSSVAKKQRKTNRKVSSDRVDYPHAFKDDAKNLSTKLIGGKVWKNEKPVGKEVKGIGDDSEKLAEIINYYDDDKNYNKLSDQAKWIAAQLASAKEMRGVLTRIKPLLEKANAQFVHSMIITWLRGIHAGINTFNPNSEWKAGFDYIVKPYVGMGEMISSERKLYDFMKEKILPSLLKYENRIRQLVYEKDSSDNYTVQKDDFESFYFDNKLLYSTMKVVDEKDRFVIIDRGEIHSLLSAVNFTISSTLYALAYDWSGLLKTVNNIGETYGFRNLVNADPGKMTAKNRIEKIKKSKGLFVLIPADKSKGVLKGGKDWTAEAYLWLRAGVREGKKAWTYTRDFKGNGEQFPILDPRSIQPFSRIVDTSFENIEELIEGSGVKSTLINGEEIQVNFKNFFDNPPRDLKAFLATGFEGGKEKITDPKTKITYRNYHFENPNKWDLNAYKPYFPNIDQDGVKKTGRILTQAWGSSVIGAFFAPVLF